MSDDVKAGDVVVCVDANVIQCPNRPSLLHAGLWVAEGSHYRVARVTGGQSNCGCPTFVMVCGALGNHARFRKIDAPKTEISERIRACRPIKVGEDA